MCPSTQEIKILAMGTWGALGNRLAAEKLGDELGTVFPNASIEIRNTEEFVPVFAEFGSRIGQLSTKSCSDDKTVAYNDIMSEVSRLLPAGFEHPDAGMPNSLAAGINDLRSFVGDDERAVLIGTKGISSRLLVRAASARQKVVNYVTNPGLLDIEIHRSHYFDHWIVGFKFAKELLINKYGCEQKNISVVGPMIAGLVKDDGNFAASVPRRQERVGLIVFCNRDPDRYLQLLQALGPRSAELALVFVCPHNQTAVQTARELAAQHNAEHWNIHGSLTQVDYVGYLNQMRSLPGAALVAKAGPNTVLESVSLGLPVLTLRSGLPMELWVEELIADWKVGECHADVNDLEFAISRLLADSSRLTKYAENAALRRKELPSIGSVRARLKEVIETVQREAKQTLFDS